MSTINFKITTKIENKMQDTSFKIHDKKFLTTKDTKNHKGKNQGKIYLSVDI